MTVDVVSGRGGRVGFVLAAAASSFSAERQCHGLPRLRKNHRVTLTISNRGPRDQYVTVRDDVPQDFLPSPDQFVTAAAGRSRSTVHYELKAGRRGAYRDESRLPARTQPTGTVAGAPPLSRDLAWFTSIPT